MGKLAFHMRGVTQAEVEAEISSVTSLLTHSRARCQRPEDCSLDKPAVKTCTLILRGAQIPGASSRRYVMLYSSHKS